MKKLILSVLVLVMCSVAYGVETRMLSEWFSLQSKYEIMARESHFRYKETEKFHEYRIEITEYKNKLLSKYGY